MSDIIARSVELKRFERLYQSNQAEFMALYGRRRIGKTYLVSQYFKNKGIYFEVTGIKNARISSQLKKFHKEFCRLFITEPDLAVPADWDEALSRLVDEVSKIPQTQKVVIFFDELPWLATPRSQLVQELDYYWNRHFSRMNNVLLIICGSAAAWMIHHIIKNKDGLYGRLSDQICLHPFTIGEVELYMRSRGVNLDRKQIAELFMVTGGIAKYLSFVKPGMSAAQNIDELCFTTQGPLYSEFNELFSSLFGDARLHMQVVKALASRRQGFTRDELLDYINMKSGGTITKILDELETSDLIMTIKKYNADSKESLIRLTDEYSYFYLNWVEPVKRDILYGADTNRWQKLSTGHGWKSWSGFTFETICLKHIHQIKSALGLAAVTTTHSQWFYRPKDNSEDGAQIDLILDRADNCINLFEFKFSNDEFVITKEYAKKLENKKLIFQQKTKTKKTIFITMITPYGVKKNSHYLGLIDNQLLLDDLFGNY